jgi:hypothetical protein
VLTSLKKYIADKKNEYIDNETNNTDHISMELDPDSGPVTTTVFAFQNVMSATYVRKYADENDKIAFAEHFKDLYGIEYANKVYDKILLGKTIGEEALSLYNIEKESKKKTRKVAFKSNSTKKTISAKKKNANDKSGGKIKRTRKRKRKQTKRKKRKRKQTKRKMN